MMSFDPLINFWSLKSFPFDFSLGKNYSARYFDLFRKRIQLPVWEYKEEFFKVLSDNQVRLVFFHESHHSLLSASVVL